MQDRAPRRPQTGLGNRQRKAVVQRATTTKEQAANSHGKPETGTLTQEKDKRPKLTLKDGYEVDARSALVLLESLRAKLEVHPDQFRSLLALAEGRHEDTDPAHLKHLQDQGYLESAGSIRPEVRSILLSAYTASPEGVVLVNPFRLQNEGEKQVAERADEQIDQVIRDWLSGPGDGGRSR